MLRETQEGVGVRFVSPGQKAAVIAVLVALNGALMVALDVWHVEGAAIILSLVQLAGWYLVTRVFRGPGEKLRRARPWWRMTNRAPLSGLLGAGYGLLAVTNIGFSFAGYGSLSGTVSILVELVLAWLFLTSFVRLRALAPAHA